MIRYQPDAEGVTPADLLGFFVGWPDPPAPAVHLRMLQGSAHVELARDGDRVVGFVTALSDGVLTAFIPLLEVLPDYQGRGIGSELTRRLLARLEPLYVTDLVCDENLVPYYERFGLRRGTAMLRRNYPRQSGR